MELGNWPIKVQLGSTNSKGLPVLFQGSQQGFLLNNQLIHYDGSNGHAHCHPVGQQTNHRIQSTNAMRGILPQQQPSLAFIDFVSINPTTPTHPRQPESAFIP